MEAVRDPAPLGRSRCLTPLVCSPFAGGKSPHFVASSPSSSIYLAWAYGAGTSPTGYSYHGSSRGYISGFPSHTAPAPPPPPPSPGGDIFDIATVCGTPADSAQAATIVEGALTACWVRALRGAAGRGAARS